MGRVCDLDEGNPVILICVRQLAVFSHERIAFAALCRKELHKHERFLPQEIVKVVARGNFQHLRESIASSSRIGMRAPENAHAAACGHATARGPAHLVHGHGSQAVHSSLLCLQRPCPARESEPPRAIPATPCYRSSCMFWRDRNHAHARRPEPRCSGQRGKQHHKPQSPHPGSYSHGRIQAWLSGSAQVSHAQKPKANL